MASKPSDSQARQYRMTWDEVLDRLNPIIELVRCLEHDPVHVWGVPRGGAVVAGMLAGYADVRLCDSVDELPHLIVDDIIDTGATLRSFKNVCQRVAALVDKRNESEPLRDRWVVFPWETADEACGPTDNVRRLLEVIGEDPTREGLVKTPERVVKALLEMTEGYRMDAEQVLSTCFESSADEMVVLSHIQFTSLCEHHLLPFVGEAAVGYLPQGRVIGISKLARVVQMFARRLQVQENMTTQIAHAIQECLKPRGVGVVVRAHHQCMSCRGVKQPNTEMVTSCMLGEMRSDSAARAELMHLLKD